MAPAASLVQCLCSSPLFICKAWLGRLGESCHCVVYWGWGRKRFSCGFFNLFCSFCAQNELRQKLTCRVQSSLNLLSRVLVISISQLSVFLPPPHPNLAFFLLLPFPLRVRWDLKAVWGAALCIAQPRKYKKRGEGTSLPPAGIRNCLCTGRTGRGGSGPLVLSTLNFSGH